MLMPRKDKSSNTYNLDFYKTNQLLFVKTKFSDPTHIEILSKLTNKALPGGE